MKEQFDFNRIGKRMPYTAPEGFLDDIETNVWEALKKEATPEPPQEAFVPVSLYGQADGKVTPAKPKRTHRLLYTISGGLVAASIALLLVFNIRPDHQKTDDLEIFEQAFSNLSSTDQDYLLTVYQDDLFMNE